MNDNASQITELLTKIGPYFGIEDRNRLLAYKLLDDSTESVLTHPDQASTFGNPELSAERMLASQADPILKLASTLMNITNGGRYVTDVLEPKNIVGLPPFKCSRSPSIVFIYFSL